MKRIVLLFILILTAVAGSVSVNAQLIPVEDQKQFVDSLRREFDSGPYFGLYKDNYFTVGVPVGPKITRNNSDVKFQISIAQRLTKSTLPWNTYLFLTYTQKNIWRVFENSLPMRDMNFNPGIGIAKPIFSKDRYVGKIALMLEHESNGRDSIWSRSWNRVSLSGSVMIDDWLMVHAKFWIPIIDGMHNKDILKYAGIWQNGVAVTTPDKKFGWAITLVKRAGWNLNFNTIFEFNWRVHKQSNQYIFLQYYNGYGENLLDFKEFRSQLRVGIVIKPKFFSEF